MRADILSDLLVGLNMEVTEKNQNKINIKKIQKKIKKVRRRERRGEGPTQTSGAKRVLWWRVVRAP